MSKVILALPTTIESVDIFDKTLTGGFSCVNTRLPFDIEVLLSNLKVNGNEFKLKLQIKT